MQVYSGTNPEKVFKFLRDHTPAPICDDCIAKGINARREPVNVMTAVLGLTREFDKRHGTCSLCKNDKLVTRSLHA